MIIPRTPKPPSSSPASSPADLLFWKKSKQKTFTGYHTLWPLFITFVRVADHAALTFRPTCGRVRCKLIGKSEQKTFTGYHQLSGSPAVPQRLYALARSQRLRLRRGTMQTYRKKRAKGFYWVPSTFRISGSSAAPLRSGSFPAFAPAARYDANLSEKASKRLFSGYHTVCESSKGNSIGEEKHTKTPSSPLWGRGFFIWPGK